jgi:hypothetical protein
VIFFKKKKKGLGMNTRKITFLGKLKIARFFLSNLFFEFFWNTFHQKERERTQYKKKVVVQKE